MCAQQQLLVLQAEKLVFLASIARFERRPADSAKTERIDDFEEADTRVMLLAEMAEELGMDTSAGPTGHDLASKLIVID